MDIDAGIVEVNLVDIVPNRFQPRLSFDEKALNELAESIKAHGIIQPLVLRKTGDKYEIIAGERRFRAAGMAGLTKVPAVIANIDENTSAEVALVENVQRKNLTAIEEAKSYKNLLDKGYLTQEDLAKRMGLSQSTISNKLRLLTLDDEVQEALLNEKISERHARSLLQLDTKEEQKNWLNRVIRDRMTVRQLDLEIKKLKGDDSADIPLVSLTPDIDEIKNNAIDINPIKEESVTKDEFKDIPEAIDTTPKEQPRKFFNFLEDEAVNMNVAETPTMLNTLIDTPPVPGALNKVVDEIEVLDIPNTLPAEPVMDDTVIEREETLNPEQLSTLQSLLNESAIPNNIPIETPTLINEPFQPAPSNTITYQSQGSNEILDPVSMIEKLDPQYTTKTLQSQGLDLNSAISSIRDSVKTVEDKGFKIDTEEVDFPSTYQIIINIGKDNS